MPYYLSNIISWIIPILIVILVLAVIAANVRVVQQSKAVVVERLGALLGSPVTTSPQARYAGAIGAAIRAQALA